MSDKEPDGDVMELREVPKANGNGTGNAGAEEAAAEASAELDKILTAIKDGNELLRKVAGTSENNERLLQLEAEIAQNSRLTREISQAQFEEQQETNAVNKENKKLDVESQQGDYGIQIGQYNRRTVGAAFQVAGTALKTVSALNQDQRSQKAFQTLAGTTAIVSTLAGFYNTVADRSGVVQKSEQYDATVLAQKENTERVARDRAAEKAAAAAATEGVAPAPATV